MKNPVPEVSSAGWHVDLNGFSAMKTELALAARETNKEKENMNFGMKFTPAVSPAIGAYRPNVQAGTLDRRESVKAKVLPSTTNYLVPLKGESVGTRMAYLLKGSIASRVIAANPQATEAFRPFVQEGTSQFSALMHAVDDVMKTASVQLDDGRQLTAKTALLASPYLELLVKGFGIKEKELEPLKNSSDGQYSYDNLHKVKNETKNKIRKAILMLSLELGAMRQEIVSRLRLHDGLGFIDNVAADPEQLLLFGTCLLNDYSYRDRLMDEVNMSLAMGMERMFAKNAAIESKGGDGVSYAYVMYREALDSLLSQAAAAALNAGASRETVAKIIEKVRKEEEKEAKQRNHAVHLEALAKLGHSAHSLCVMMKLVASSHCFEGDHGVNGWAIFVLKEMKENLPLLDDLFYVRMEQRSAIVPMRNQPSGQSDQLQATPTDQKAGQGTTKDARQEWVNVDLAPVRNLYIGATHRGGVNHHKDVARVRTLIANQFRTMHFSAANPRKGKTVVIDLDVPAIVKAILSYVSSAEAAGSAADSDIRILLKQTRPRLADTHNSTYRVAQNIPPTKETLENLASCIRNEQHIICFCRSLLQAQFSLSLEAKAEFGKEESYDAGKVIQLSSKAILLDAMYSQVMKAVSEELRGKLDEKQKDLSKMHPWVPSAEMLKMHDDAQQRLQAEAAMRAKAIAEQMKAKEEETEEETKQSTEVSTISEKKSGSAELPKVTNSVQSTQSAQSAQSAQSDCSALVGTSTSAPSGSTQSAYPPADRALNVDDLVRKSMGEPRKHLGTSSSKKSSMTQSYPASSCKSADSPSGSTQSSSGHRAMSVPLSTSALSGNSAVSVPPSIPLSSSSSAMSDLQNTLSKRGFSVAQLSSPKEADLADTQPMTTTSCNVSTVDSVPSTQLENSDDSQADLRKKRMQYLEKNSSSRSASSSPTSEEFRQLAENLQVVPAPRDVSHSTDGKGQESASSAGTPVPHVSHLNQQSKVSQTRTPAEVKLSRKRKLEGEGGEENASSPKQIKLVDSMTLGTQPVQKAGNSEQESIPASLEKTQQTGAHMDQALLEKGTQLSDLHADLTSKANEMENALVKQNDVVQQVEIESEAAAKKERPAEVEAERQRQVAEEAEAERLRQVAGDEEKIRAAEARAEEAEAKAAEAAKLLLEERKRKVKPGRKRKSDDFINPNCIVDRRPKRRVTPSGKPGFYKV